MEYVDGGYRSSRRVYIPVRSFRMSTASYIDATNAANTFIGIAIGVLTGACGVGLLGSTVAALFGVFATSKGQSTADALRLDRADGYYDGMLTVTVGGSWVTENNPYPPNSYQGATF